jgi:hypothetical protein
MLAFAGGGSLFEFQEIILGAFQCRGFFVMSQFVVTEEVVQQTTSRQRRYHEEAYTMS